MYLLGVKKKKVQICPFKGKQAVVPKKVKF